MVKNSKILVAGGTGFIGSNLISELIANDNTVISLSKNINPKKKRIKNVKYFFHDLNKPLKIEEYGFLSDVQYIINCSGYIDHKDSLKEGKIIFYNHFDSVCSLINLGIELGVKSLIHIGSSDEYGNLNSPLKESIREKPISPYSLGKLTSTHFLQQCYRKGILNTVILRPFLVFGEMQGNDRFLPYLINNCLNDREFKVSKGEQIRDYLYVKEFNKGLIKALDNKNAYGEVINIASGNPIRIKDVIKIVQEIIGKGKPIFGAIDYRRGESMELYADIQKAKTILNWSPRIDFKKSLKKTINWYLENGQ